MKNILLIFILILFLTATSCSNVKYPYANRKNINYYAKNNKSKNSYPYIKGRGSSIKKSKFTRKQLKKCRKGF